MKVASWAAAADGEGLRTVQVGTGLINDGVVRRRDWGPYTTTATTAGTGTFSKGIVKSVYLVTTASTTIPHVVPLSECYQSRYPGPRFLSP